ncbi:hypothetical protein [Megaira polyxenophila phage MAnkyphage_25.80]|nr:hypothetical protein [Megaira polyxenophila phage MAnkyphage_25.80]
MGGVRKWFRPKQPPAPIRELSASESIASKYTPINFVSIMDGLMGNKLDVVRGVDGKISMNFTNPNGRTARMSPERNIDERAVEVIALSEAMTRLGTAIEQLEATSPYLIPQNQELINSYKTAVSSALDRGFDFRQQAIDTKLSKMGLSNSSTALGVQVALARERANAMAEAELKQAELAQGLKQQAIGNIMNRGKLLESQANTELGRFATETGNQMQLRGQDIQKEIALSTLDQDRQKFLTAAGLDALNTGNQQTINAGAVDASRVSGLNNAQYNRYAMTSNPMREMLGAFTSAASGALGKGIVNKFLPTGEDE